MTTALQDVETIKVIANIIQSEMGLADGQVMLEYSKNKINTDPGIYVVLSNISGKIIGNINSSVSTVDGMTEIQKVSAQEIFQIDIMSFDSQARIRRMEIPMALRSIYSQQQQELYGISIARIPQDMVNAASLEETKILNRFTCSILVNSTYTKTKAAPYYDQFPAPEVLVNV